MGGHPYVSAPAPVFVFVSASVSMSMSVPASASVYMCLRASLLDFARRKSVWMGNCWAFS